MRILVYIFPYDNLNTKTYINANSNIWINARHRWCSSSSFNLPKTYHAMIPFLVVFWNEIFDYNDVPINHHYHPLNMDYNVQMLIIDREMHVLIPVVIYQMAHRLYILKLYIYKKKKKGKNVFL